MFLQQIALYACVGLIMDASGQSWDTPLYWCMITVIIVSNYLARKEGFMSGLETAKDVLELSNRILDDAKKYVDDHSEKIAKERAQLVNTLEAIKDKHDA